MQIAGLQDFRQEGPPADLGTYQLPCTVLVFQHVFAGTTYNVAIRGGVRGWVLIAIGTDAATVINAAIASLTVGGLIHIKIGTYTLTTTILVNKDGAQLEGEGYQPETPTGTVFVLANNINLDMINVSTRKNMIRNMFLDGNLANNLVASSGIYGSGALASQDLHLENVYMYNVRTYGAYLTGWHCSCHNVIIEFSTNGFYSTGQRNDFYACIAFSCTTNGFWASGGTNAFTLCLAVGGVQGFYMGGGMQLVTCKALLCGQSGICFDGSAGSIVIGCKAIDCCTAINNLYAAIKLSNSSTYNICIGNQISSTQANKPAYGFYEDGTASTNNLYIGNIIQNCLTRTILLQGPTSKAFSNTGYNPYGHLANAYTVAAGYITDATAAQDFPSSGVNYTIGHSPKLITIYAGIVTSISIDGVVCGLTSGAFRLEPGQIFNVVWTGQPSSEVYMC